MQGLNLEQEGKANTLPTVLLLQPSSSYFKRKDTLRGKAGWKMSSGVNQK